MTQPLDDAMDELRDLVRTELRMGFTPRGEVVEAVLYMAGVEDGDEGRMRPIVEHLLRVETAALLREQAGWPAVTDCDRLDRAFDALEARGIVARQHFSCCQNCGSGEIWDEMDEAGHEGMAVRGYAFYHMQDTEGALSGGGLYLAYGAVEEDGIAAIGREVVAVLNAQGLATRWDGSPEQRIHVAMDWKRRGED